MTNKHLAQAQIPKSFRALVKRLEAFPDYPRRVANLLATLREKLPQHEAARFALAIQQLAPHDPVVNALMSRIVRKSVPLWQFACLEDAERNLAYERALTALVTSDTIVLDIGAGSGLFSLMAARAGAKHVYAVEFEPLTAHAAVENIARNGLSEKITVICKDILNVQLGDEIPQRCNMVVQDVIWADPFSAGILPLLRHAAEHLLTADALFLPERIDLRAMINGSDSQLTPLTGGIRNGFDLSAMDKFAPKTRSISRPLTPRQPLSKPFTLREYDISHASRIKPGADVTTVTPSATGTAHHLLQWIALKFPDGTIVDAQPSQLSCRQLMVHHIDPPIKVSPDQTLTLDIETLEDRICVGIHR